MLDTLSRWFCGLDRNGQSSFLLSSSSVLVCFCVFVNIFPCQAKHKSNLLHSLVIFLKKRRRDDIIDHCRSLVLLFFIFDCALLVQDVF
jgi:hypothetical protein